MKSLDFFDQIYPGKYPLPNFKLHFNSVVPRTLTVWRGWMNQEDHSMSGDIIDHDAWNYSLPKLPKVPAIKLDHIHGVLPFDGVRNPGFRSSTSHTIWLPYRTAANDWRPKVGICESAAEAAVAHDVLLDPDIYDVVFQPLKVEFELDGESREYTHDLLITQTNGHRRLVFVRNEESLTKPKTWREIAAITSVTEVTDGDALDELMLEYYGVIVGKLMAVGGPGGYTPSGIMASFWPNLHKILPPTGRLLLVHDAADRLVGCAQLQQASVDAGESKRLYIRPEANGNGLGRRLVAAQIGAARSMGWRRLVTNIIKGNKESIRIFEALGFRYIDRYPECFDPIELDPWFVYMQRDLI